MPDDTDNVSDNTAETSCRTNWFPDSLADNAQKRPLAPPGLPLVIALADGRKTHHGQIDGITGHVSATGSNDRQEW